MLPLQAAADEVAVVVHRVVVEAAVVMAVVVGMAVAQVAAVLRQEAADVGVMVVGVTDVAQARPPVPAVAELPQQQAQAVAVVAVVVRAAAQQLRHLPGKLPTVSL